MTGRAQEIVTAIKQQLGIPNVVAEFAQDGVTVTVSTALHMNQIRVYNVKGIDAATCQCLIEEFETLALEERCNIVWRVDSLELTRVLADNRYTRFPSATPTMCKSHVNILRERQKESV